jgi:large subunit ribosomal protein L9
MQVILLDKVVNLGGLGEIVKVKDGYARNFLIPTGRARRATEAAKAEFEARRAELEKQAAEKLAAAQAVGEKLNGQTIKLTQKAGVDGRLFGSVTNHDIADELKKQGFDVHKSQVRLPNGPIKTVGDNTVRCTPTWTPKSPSLSTAKPPDAARPLAALPRKAAPSGGLVVSGTALVHRCGAGVPRDCTAFPQVCPMTSAAVRRSMGRVSRPHFLHVLCPAAQLRRPR